METSRAYIDRAAAPPTEWETPHWLFDRLSATFGPFTLDPACQVGQWTATCVTMTQGGIIYTPKEDGLVQPWRGKVYVNPPYDKSLAQWVETAAHEAAAVNGPVLIAMLLPVRTGRPWWQKYVTKANAIMYLPGRLQFEGAENSAPFDSAVALWWRL